MKNIRYIATILCLIPAIALSAEKARPDNLEPLEEIPPPAIVDGNPADESTLEPEVTIRKKDTETVEEYRINGQLYMMKVTPNHGVPYYLHKDDQDGSWINDGPTKPFSIPKWILFRF
jgi:Protein of unknown function (DUF2782)